MRCLECGSERRRLGNGHLLACCGLTLHEYALRHHLPLDVILGPEQVNCEDPLSDYPLPQGAPSAAARGLVRGLHWAGLLKEEGGFSVVPGEVRRLDLLLWALQWLTEYGFQFRQEYHYDNDTHRVVARNRLKAPRAAVADVEADGRLSPPHLLDSLATLVAYAGEVHSGYLFLDFASASVAEAVVGELGRHYAIGLEGLDLSGHPEGGLYRCRGREDTRRLFSLLDGRLGEMPGVRERLTRPGPEASVVKELVFDAAHFITDHPAKCSNLHGGRYRLQVKISDRIDPVTGCVVDYGYLKRVANHCVVDRFDHHNLNYAASELAWRSSTELLCVYIWEQLIPYLPGLSELKLYETTQSWCCYTGPDLAQFQSAGGDPVLRHFQDPRLGGAPWRRLASPAAVAPLRVVAER